MRKGLAKLGIDWSNSATFVMLWFASFCVIYFFMEPRHGGWRNRIVWSPIPTSSSKESPPQWFPIPLFAADPELRVVKGLESSLQDDRHLLLGVTTYPEWMGAGDMFRMRDGTGAIVIMRREDVVVMPLHPDKNSAVGFEMPWRESAPSEQRARFPMYIHGGIQRGWAGSNLPSHDVIDLYAVYPKNERATATLLRFEDGSLMPVDATLYLSGLSRAAKWGMTIAAVVASVVAYLGTWVLQILSRRMERRSKPS